MKYGQIAGIDKPVSRLVQGTAMINSAQEERWFGLLDGVFELGCNAFDTAHIYGRGDCERTLGRWISSRGVRSKIVIITKGVHPIDGVTRVNPQAIDSDVNDSLERLQVDYIDLYLLHRDDPNVPVEPLIECLNKHLQAGHIKAFGASNWSHERIEQANTYAKQNGLTPFAISSPQFSLAEASKPPWEGCISISGNEGKDAREWYLEHNMPLLTWSSLAGGFFSGRFTRENFKSFNVTSYWDQVVIDAYCIEDNFQRLDRANELANQKGLSLPQIALAYILNQPLDIYGLVGTHTPDEFATNIASLDVELTKEELDWLNLRTETLTSSV